MDIYADISIRNGECVTLVRGEMDRPVPTGKSPLAMAEHYIAEGAEWLHVVDLDRIVGEGDNSEEICRILALGAVPVQVGGGIRTLGQAQELMDWGATRIVVGTSAIVDPELLNQLAAVWPRRVAVSVDVWKGRVAVHGWRTITSFEPIGFMDVLNKLELAAIILTDIDRDVDLPDSSFALTMQVGEAAVPPIITSGTIKTLDDISTVRYLPRISGAIVGRAFVSGAFTLAEALAVARQ